MRRPDERDLRAVLRDEADRHRPDREAMLNRVAQGRSAPARRPIDRLLVLLRPVAAAVAVAVVLVLAVAGVRLSSGPDGDDHQVAAPTVTPAPTTTTTAAPKPSGTPGKGPKTSPTRTIPPDDSRDGFLDSAGKLDSHSNDGWSQQNVELETTRTLTAVDVTVTVALTRGVVETGRWTTVPTNMIAMSSRKAGKKLVYRFTLRQGYTLAPGRYTFAVQFNHGAGKRTLAGDGYRAEATAGDRGAKVTSGFTAS